jgi:hypothetical protein
MEVTFFLEILVSANKATRCQSQENSNKVEIRIKMNKNILLYTDPLQERDWHVNTDSTHNHRPRSHVLERWKFSFTSVRYFIIAAQYDTA